MRVPLSFLVLAWLGIVLCLIMIGYFYLYPPVHEVKLAPTYEVVNIPKYVYSPTFKG